MAFIKLGENISFSPEKNILSAKEALSDRNITLNFIKMAKQLKKIAPRAQDFIYCSCVMMHAAEASLVDQETGEVLKNKKGKPVSGAFVPFKYKGKESVKWESPDDIKVYKNQNGDIFPEEELIKAHKMWVGKPLCKDHKSDSVDGIRGIIIDTYYDPKFKRVHALFALDKKNYADLARKVETGYANSVSMGTAVGRSICTECGNPAKVEREYCEHVRARSNYGEINLDLNPIELSLVVNGADSRAKIKTIVAHMNEYVKNKQNRINELISDRCVNPSELQGLADSISDIQKKLNSLTQFEKVANSPAYDVGELVAARREAEKLGDPDLLSEINKKLKELFGISDKLEGELAEQITTDAPDNTDIANYHTDSESGKVGWPPFDTSRRLANVKEGDEQGALYKEINLLRSKVNAVSNAFGELKQLISKEENNMNSARLRARAKARRAYWLGGGGVNEPTPGKPKYEKEDADSIRDKEDKQMVGEPLDTGSEGLHPGDEGKSYETRGVSKKKASNDELKQRALRRRAYWFGGGGINEPTPGKPKYEKEDADSVRNTEDKQMTGTQNMGGTDGMVPGDAEVKKKLLRANLTAKFTKVADQSGNVVKEASHWDLYAGDKLLLSASAADIFEDEINASVEHPEFKTNWDYLSSKQYGQDLIRHVRQDGLDHVTYLLKGAAPAELPADLMAAPSATAPAPATAPVAPAPAAAPAALDSEKVNAALSTMEEKISEIRDLVSGTDSGELAEVDAGDKEAPMEGVLASLQDDALRVEALLNDSADELALVSEALDAGNVNDSVLKIAGQALNDGLSLIAEADMVIEAAKKKKDKSKSKSKAKAKKKVDTKEDEKDDDAKKELDDEKKEASDKLLSDALRLRAENRAAMLSMAMEDFTLESGDEASLLKLLKQERKEKDSSGKLMHPDLADDDDVYSYFTKDEIEEILKRERDLVEDDKEEAERHDVESKFNEDQEESDAKDTMCAEDHAHTSSCATPALVVEVSESNDAVLASRKAERDSLLKKAADVLGKYELSLDKADNVTEPTFFAAHPGGKGTVTELTHSKTPEAKVETISEVHEVMRDVAESGPRNVREAAAEIQEQLVKGAYKVEDIDRLVAEGKVDGTAAAYWKKYFAQASNAGSFGADLSKEFVTKKKEASLDEVRAKMRRAYAVGLQAQEKGVIASTKESLDSYVDELMNLDDAGFESIKRIMASVTTGKKTSGSLPMVGSDAASEPINVTASVDSSASASLNIFEQLARLGWK